MFLQFPYARITDKKKNHLSLHVLIKIFQSIDFSHPHRSVQIFSNYTVQMRTQSQIGKISISAGGRVVISARNISSDPPG